MVLAVMDGDEGVGSLLKIVHSLETQMLFISGREEGWEIWELAGS